MPPSPTAEPDTLAGVEASATGAFDDAAFDPGPPPAPERPRERWWGNHLGEMRWQLELARLLVDPVYRGSGVPRGDGAPLILIPGFLAGDSSLAVMREWLARIGYRPKAAGILANVDCSDRAVNDLEKRLEKLADRHGRKVALIGHSRGAHFAKALAHRRPELVSSAISIGAGLNTPFDISVPTQAAVAAFRSLHSLTSDRIARNGCFSAECRCRFSDDYGGDFPADVPLTSIYSKGDGVVRWRACVVDYARCVEVSGSHVGLAFNRKVYRELAETLARETAAA
ncbi:MAG: triacylglycerol lipase [Thermoleophilaceae bacterium]|jgi:pimeloyl-ACP methyl ester carboxylesterase|nr:triacylglycerol lipase [Thermoleophilaceae bacterium]